MDFLRALTWVNNNSTGLRPPRIQGLRPNWKGVLFPLFFLWQSTMYGCITFAYVRLSLKLFLLRAKQALQLRSKDIIGLVDGLRFVGRALWNTSTVGSKTGCKFQLKRAIVGPLPAYVDFIMRYRNFLLWNQAHFMCSSPFYARNPKPSFNGSPKLESEY